MQKRFLYSILFTAFISTSVLAHSFVPDFKLMKTLRCDFNEVIYNQDNSVVSDNTRFKIFRLDDVNKKIYLAKEPIDKVPYYEEDRIEYELQSLTDDFIEMSKTVIDRQNMKIHSTSVINYDNPIFGVRHSKSEGVCRFLD